MEREGIKKEIVNWIIIIIKTKKENHTQDHIQSQNQTRLFRNQDQYQGINQALIQKNHTQDQGLCLDQIDLYLVLFPNPTQVEDPIQIPTALHPTKKGTPAGRDQSLYHKRKKKPRCN